ncbi:MAG: DNA alkylation repair protein [Patescibacteria group bacterium]
MNLKIKQELQKIANPVKAKILQGFFKTAKGQYGEGDKFLGIVVPELRKVAKKYFAEIDLKNIAEFLKSEYHEQRLLGVFMLVSRYEKADKKLKTEIFKFYLANTRGINNWDLVDLSAPNILGDYLLDKKAKRKILYKLVKSKNLWQRRMSILATFRFIRHNEYDDALKISEILLSDQHDLIHKAVGWMLREIGKRNQKVEEEFLEKHYQTMPRTMLRYAIEKFDPSKRKYYLNN